MSPVDPLQTFMTAGWMGRRLRSGHLQQISAVNLIGDRPPQMGNTRKRTRRRHSMRVAIMGSGGIGGPLGASLAQAGDDVTFIARGAHVDAIRRNGFRVEA